MQPLRREWDAIQAEMGDDLRIILDETLSLRDRAQAGKRISACYDQMVNRLTALRVLDPACGSGNFLYVSLRALKDLEAAVMAAFTPLGLPFRDVVTPNQFYGIELNSFAVQLARVVIWIGYLQWRYEQVGKLKPVLFAQISSPDLLQMPIIRDQNEDGEHIQNDDAILRYDAEGKPYEPEWPAAEVIIGNPPFLGGNRIRAEIGDKYVDELFALYQGRVPAFADMVCYWFEKARSQIEDKHAKRAGLLSTNSIRGGANRVVLERIKQTGDIFMGWSDREWTLDGAAVRVSMVGFDDKHEQERVLDGVVVSEINSDLTRTVDLTKASRLSENTNLCVYGSQQKAPFDVSPEKAELFLKMSNKNGFRNRDVVKPAINGSELTRRSANSWVIDFGEDMSLSEAEQYEAPFQFVKETIYPRRAQHKEAKQKNQWWLYSTRVQTEVLS
jgi:type II restriction/modification system DNA methylase subunit YeeA